MQQPYHIGFIPAEELESILPFLEMLNPDLEKEILRQRFRDIKNTDYKCVAVYEGAKIIAISGIWILHKIYAGKHIEPDNVIVHPAYRNKGVGEIMMEWIHAYARESGCVASELNAYVTNSNAHNFWMKQGYKIAGFHFIKNLQEDVNHAGVTNSCLPH